jgi:hypothetical protein
MKNYLFNIAMGLFTLVVADIGKFPSPQKPPTDTCGWLKTRTPIPPLSNFRFLGLQNNEQPSLSLL